MKQTPYNEEYLEKYVRLVVRKGVNLQPGQELVVTSPVDGAFFARKVVEEAYDAGASNVHLRWVDDFCTRAQYLRAADPVFDEYPEWHSLMLDRLAGRGAAFLSVSASDPENLRGVEGGRLSRMNRAANTALKGYHERIMAGRNRWNVVSIPTEAWARKVFPEAAGGAEAVALLWEEIFRACRIDGGDPVANWDAHVGTLKRRVQTLNGMRLASLRFRTGLGTDLTVRLPEGHLWVGGSETARDGLPFLANIPTEEIFSAPHRAGVDGVVVGSRPNVFRGNIIDGFSITFRDGKVADTAAERGADALKAMVADTPGMDRLGEVALVPHDSPISKRGILFYNTLYDENASCHLALGSAYGECVRGGNDLSDEEKERAGINVSDDHHDFMFGTADLCVTGTAGDGSQIPVFRDGNFVF